MIIGVESCCAVCTPALACVAPDADIVVSADPALIDG